MMIAAWLCATVTSAASPAPPSREAERVLERIGTGKGIWVVLGLPAEDHIAFAVEDLERACLEAEASGLRCEVPRRTYEWGKSAYLRDPDGRLVELHELPSG